MLIRFLLIPFTAALLLLGLQLKHYFGYDLLGLFVAAPAYVLTEDLLPLMFHPDGLDVLAFTLLGWSALVLAPFWYPRSDQRELRIKLTLICLPAVFLLQGGTLIWKLLDLLNFCC